MTTFNGGRVTQRGGATGEHPHEAMHGDEGLTRTQPHPLQGGSSIDTVGQYLGSTGSMGNPRTHLFSAEATGGGQTDSFAIHDTADFQWRPMSVGGRYVFSRSQAHSGSIRPYDPSVHWGIPGAPMSDTPVKYHDRNYR